MMKNSNSKAVFVKIRTFTKTIIAIFHFFSSINFLAAQSCLPNGLNLCTQQDVNNFPINYPGCTEIEGVLFIHGTSTTCSNNITNLNGLSQLQKVGGLNIDFTKHITNLAGLNNLTTINGNMLIWDNVSLTSLQGLNNLSKVHGFVYIAYNEDLVNVNALSNLDSIGGYLQVEYNPVLTSINGLQNIDPLTIQSKITQVKDLEIKSNPNLSICNLDNVCRFLGLPDRTHIISNNAPGCQNYSAVRSQCPPPPVCTQTTFPQDSATNIQIQTTISWSPVSEATGYTLSIGVSPGMYSILNQFDVGLVTEVDYLDLPCGSPIFLKVTPYNEYGFAENCTETSFTTEIVLANAGPDLEVCLFDSIQIDAQNSIGSDFFWSPAFGLSDSLSLLPSVSPMDSTLYVLTMSNEGRCIQKDSVWIYVNPLPNTNMVATNEIGYQFHNGMAKIIPDGGAGPYSMIWSTGDTTESIQNLAPGVYTVALMDSKECLTLDTAFIQAYNCPCFQVNFLVEPPSCFALCDGKISTTIDGGHSPYLLLWNGIDSVDTLINVCAGEYLLQIKDSLHCVENDTIQISQPEALSFLIDSLQHVSCFGACDGKISISTTGGSGTHHFFWNGFENLSTLENICADSVYLFIVDENDCKLTDTFLINQPEEIIIQIDSFSNIYSTQKGYIHVSYQNPNNLLYFWTGPGGFSSMERNILNLTQPGTYHLNVIDTITLCQRDTFFVIAEISSNSNPSYNAIKIYPNPAKNFISIENSFSNQQVKNIHISSGSGQKLFANLKNSGHHKDIWDISFVEPGLFFITFIFDDGSQIIKKLIVIE